MNEHPLPVSAVRLLELLQEQGPSTATTDALGASLGVSTRTVNYALTALTDAGLVDIERLNPHPTTCPSGRRIQAVEVSA